MKDSRVTPRYIIPQAGELYVYRGVKPAYRSSDMGDYGIGRYYTNSYYTAKQYGHVAVFKVRLDNPLILTGRECGELVRKYQTVTGSWYDRWVNSIRLTNDLIDQGYDSIIAYNYETSKGYFALVTFMR